MTTQAPEAPVASQPAGPTTPAGASATPQTPTSSAEQAGWLAGVPEELRNNATIKSFKDLPSALKSFIDTKSKVGDGPIFLPERDAPEEKWNEFYQAKGRPKMADDYELPTDGLPEGLVITPNDQAEIKKTAFELGLNKVEAAKLYRIYADRIAHAVATNKKAHGEQLASQKEQLQAEWGQAFDSRLKLAQDTIAKVGGEDLMRVLTETGAINNARLLSSFGKLGKMFSEDEVRGAGQRANVQMTPQEAQAAFDKYGQDNRKILMNAGDANHKQVKARWDELSKMTLTDKPTQE